MTNLGVFIESGSRPWPSQDEKPWLLAHGGAGPEDPKGVEQHQAVSSLLSLLTEPPIEWKESELRERWKKLTELERKALQVIHGLESEPHFNAGLGASLQKDGAARLSASYMESKRRKFSAVINVQNIIHPIDLALWLQDERFSVLDSLGAENLKNLLRLPNANPVTQKRLRRWTEHRRLELSNQVSHGKMSTVGVVGIGDDGALVAMTSTGGVGNETPGRVGDSPTIAGNYCSRNVATSCTGIGEQIISHAVGPRLAVAYSMGQSLRAATDQLLDEAGERGDAFAFISIASRAESKEFEWIAGSVNCQMVWAADSF